MLNVLSDLSNNFGDEDGVYKDLLTMDSEDPVPVDGGAEFLLNSGLSLFLDFGLGERSVFKANVHNASATPHNLLVIVYYLERLAVDLYDDTLFKISWLQLSHLRLALRYKW